GAERPARPQHRLATSHVFSAWPNELAGAHGPGDEDRGAVDLDLLLGNHPVRALGHGRPGEDAERLPPPHASLAHPPPPHARPPRASRAGAVRLAARVSTDRTA